MVFDVTFRKAAEQQIKSQLQYEEDQRRKNMTPEEIRKEEERKREIYDLNEKLNREQEERKAAVAAAEERTRAERVRLAQARERLQILIERRGQQIELLRFAPENLEFRHDPRLWPRVTQEQIDIARAELEGLEKAEKANAPQPPSIPAEEKTARPVYTARQRKPGVCSVCDQWVPDTTTPWHKGALPGDICIVDPIGALRSGIVTRQQLVNLGLIKE
jgi:hypothetical protein